MIPTLIFLFIRRYNRRHPGMIRKYILLAGKVILAAVALCLVHNAAAQGNELLYDVVRNNKKIGTLKIQCSSYANKVWYKLESDIKIRFIVSFTAEAHEETIFENGVIVYSSLYRKLNGKEKANKKMVLTASGYEIQDGPEKETLNYETLQNSILTLYHKEPIDVKRVYSDNHRQYLAIEKTGDHIYRLIFPDGKYNEYHYRNGVCTAIQIHHSLYNVTVRLRK
ncbi:MAG: DUF6134 family protein [Chitinophagaceae bacterium]|nr:DUF6134 family protein [Chitinophagaceae bacterium]